MVATQLLLNSMAAALVQDTYIVPAFMAFGTSIITPSITDTIIDGEIGDRVNLSNPIRTNNEVEYTALRLAGDVGDTTNGDNIRSIGTLTTETSGDLLSLVALPGILQTTNFDIDTTLKIIFN